jgi:hypothetical protein
MTTLVLHHVNVYVYVYVVLKREIEHITSIIFQTCTILMQNISIVCEMHSVTDQFVMLMQLQL